MEQPYLIQRGVIRRPINTDCISDLIALDYMGSAEFEFGALPRSLRALRELSAQGLVQVRKVESIQDSEGRHLRVLSGYHDSEFDIYVGWLTQLRANQLRTKETTRFASNYQHSRFSTADIWWDVVNHTFWTFDKVVAKKLPEALAGSWVKMA